MNNPVTLPREVVEQVRGALAYVGAGNSSTNPNLAQSTCRQAIWKLDHALRAALEQPQKKQELLTEEAIQKLIVPGDYLTLGGLVKFARSVEQAVSGHTGPQQREVRFAELEIALKNMQHQHKLSNDNVLQRENGQLITSSSSVPAGWKLVPVEPNEAMHRAAVRTVVHCTGNDDFPPAVYRAMLAAAPQPPAPGCKATKRGDHVVCDDCKSAWDANDKNPPACVPAPPAVEQPHVGKEPDWKDLYQKEKRRAEMWIAKYEKDIGKLQVAVPVAAQPQVEQEPAETFDEVWAAIDWGKWRMAPIRELVREIHSKTSPQPPRQPLTDEQIDTLEWSVPQPGEDGAYLAQHRNARAIERAHGIGGEK